MWLSESHGMDTTMFGGQRQCREPSSAILSTELHHSKAMNVKWCNSGQDYTVKHQTLTICLPLTTPSYPSSSEYLFSYWILLNRKAANRENNQILTIHSWNFRLCLATSVTGQWAKLHRNWCSSMVHQKPLSCNCNLNKGPCWEGLLAYEAGAPKKNPLGWIQAALSPDLTPLNYNPCPTWLFFLCRSHDPAKPFRWPKEQCPAFFNLLQPVGKLVVPHCVWQIYVPFHWEHPLMMNISSFFPPFCLSVFRKVCVFSYAKPLGSILHSLTWFFTTKRNHLMIKQK